MFVLRTFTGEEVDVRQLARTRSGRLSRPPLDSWRGQRIATDQEGNIIEVNHGKEDCVSFCSAFKPFDAAVPFRCIPSTGLLSQTAQRHASAHPRSEAKTETDEEEVSRRWQENGCEKWQREPVNLMKTLMSCFPLFGTRLFKLSHTLCTDLVIAPFCVVHDKLLAAARLE